jgi:hypothetical protein
MHITISPDRNGLPGFALVKLKSHYEALAFIGEGEQTVDGVRVKPIAPGADVGTVCCRIIQP